VAPGSIVTAEMTIRCKSLATQKDPGGNKIRSRRSFNMENDDEYYDGLTFDIKQV
jgi:hypothetical protein